MPYIKRLQKCDIDKTGITCTAGELNYVLTTTCLKYLNLNSESYQTYNDIIGALEGCKLELYRRKIASYEDKKILENGDCY